MDSLLSVVYIVWYIKTSENTNAQILKNSYNE